MTLDTIDDFEVLVDEKDRVIVFASESRGELASFPDWEDADRDLRHFDLDDIPYGTVDEPFEDEGAAWKIVIYEEGDFVYVHEADDPLATDYPRAFRVPRDRYMEAWVTLIDRFNRAVSLDEIFSEEE